MSCKTDDDCATTKYCSNSQCKSRKWYNNIPWNIVFVCITIMGIVFTFIRLYNASHPVTTETLINSTHLKIFQIVLLIILFLIPAGYFLYNMTRKPSCAKNGGICGLGGTPICDSNYDWQCNYNNNNSHCGNTQIQNTCPKGQQQVLNQFCKPECVSEPLKCDTSKPPTCVASNTPSTISDIGGVYNGQYFCDPITGKYSCVVSCNHSSINPTTNCPPNNVSSCIYDFNSGKYISRCVSLDKNKNKCEGQETDCGTNYDNICVQDPNTGNWGLICMENPTIEDLMLVYGIEPQSAIMVDKNGTNITCSGTDNTTCLKAINYTNGKLPTNFDPSKFTCSNNVCNVSFYTNSSGDPIYPSVTDAGGTIFPCSTDGFYGNYANSVIRNPPGYIPSNSSVTSSSPSQIKTKTK